MSLLLLPKKKSMIVHQNRLSQKQKLKLDRLLVLCCILFRSSVLLLADATSTAQISAEEDVGAPNVAQDGDFAEIQQPAATAALPPDLHVSKRHERELRAKEVQATMWRADRMAARIHAGNLCSAKEAGVRMAAQISEEDVRAVNEALGRFVAPRIIPTEKLHASIEAGNRIAARIHAKNVRAAKKAGDRIAAQISEVDVRVANVALGRIAASKEAGNRMAAQMSAEDVRAANVELGRIAASRIPTDDLQVHKLMEAGDRITLVSSL